MNEKTFGEVELYESQDGSISINVHADGDSVWLSRQQMATLFGRDIKTIGKHIASALVQELDAIPVVAKFATTGIASRPTKLSTTVSIWLFRWDTESNRLKVFTFAGGRMKFLRNTFCKAPRSMTSASKKSVRLSAF